MNFQSLKGMIESIVKSYRCPECLSEVDESNIDIIGAAGTTINIDIECSSCGKHSMVKTEVLSLDLTNKGLNPESIEKIKNSLLSLNSKKMNKSQNNSIKDEEIINLNRELKKEGFNVSDLLGE